MNSISRAVQTGAKAGVRRISVANTLGADLTGPRQFGGKYVVTLVPGDGIGPEIVGSTKKVLRAANAAIEWEEFGVSGETEYDADIMMRALESLKRNRVGLKGILHTPISLGHSSFNVALRKNLDIYASVVQIKNFDGVKARHNDVDLVVIRENTEGEYSGLEHEPSPGVVENLKIITEKKTERVAHYAFQYALRNGRKKVTCVHKANIMKLSDGLFLRTCRRVADEYRGTGIAFEDMIVDNTTMQLVSRPQQFDVMVMPNLYGSIISNVAAGLVGGAGVVPGGNFGREYAVFEPGSRHVGMNIRGSHQANPTAMIMSSVEMLRHLNLPETALRIERAVKDTLVRSSIRTPDIGGTSTSEEFTDAVISHL